MEDNRQKLVNVTNHLCKSSMERRSCITDTKGNLDLLTKRQKDAIDMHNDIHANNGERESNGFQEDSHGSTAVLLGSNVAVKNAVRPIKLPEIKRLPPYTTWIFLDRFVEITVFFVLIEQESTPFCVFVLMVNNRLNCVSFLPLFVYLIPYFLGVCKH